MSDLPAEKIIRVLENIKSKYDSRKITVALTGGEPLCYPDLFELGRRIFELQFPWGMVTNGFSWNVETLHRALQSGIHSITVSLDGTADEHNWLRGHPESFERAVRTIKMFVDSPIAGKMDIVTCINKRNIHKLDNFYDFIHKLGVKSWRFFIISPIGRATFAKELLLNGDEIRFLMEKIVEFKKRDEIQCNYSESGYLGCEYENQVRDHDHFCTAGVNVSGIMVNGDILACPNINRKFSQGNIDEKSFVEVWENGYRPFRNREWMRTGDCKECREWQHCKGNGFHLREPGVAGTKLCHHKLLTDNRKEQGES